jgi:hypothetical protein
MADHRVRTTMRDDFPKLPHDVESERSVLGSILLDNQSLVIATETLNPADFFLSQHHHIFDCMLSMGEKHIPIDLWTLKDQLEKAGDLEVAGGVPYISALMDDRPRVTNMAHYCAIVKQKSILRSLIHATNTIQQNAFEAKEDAGTLVKRATASLTMIGANCTPGESYREMFHTMTDFENSPGLTFAIDGFLQTRAATMVAGLSGQSKTFILLSMASSLLTGKKLWDLFDVKEVAARLVYLIPESSIGPFKHRLALFGLMEYVKNERLLIRTLSKGPTPLLSDPRILRAAQGADIFLDTAVRFNTEGNENDAADNQRGLAADIFALLGSGARLVVGAHHAPKNFATQTTMNLENVARGSGDITAMLATCWGVRQLDQDRNIVYVQNVKARDFEPCPPFELIGRPYIDAEGNFRVFKHPGESKSLAEELPDSTQNRKPSGASMDAREAKAAKLALLRKFLIEQPNLSTQEIADLYSKAGIKIQHGTIRAYKSELTNSK